jgi:hypothetical protein
MPDDSKKPKPPRPRFAITAQAANAIVDLISGRLKKGSPEELDACRAVAWCFREAATVFAEIDQWLAAAGYRASVDPAIWLLLATTADPDMRDLTSVRLVIERAHHRGRPKKFDDRQIAEYVWHLVKRRGWKRTAAYEEAAKVFKAKVSTVEKAIDKWEPIYEWAEALMPNMGQPRMRAMTRTYATTPTDDADRVAPAPDEKKPDP